VTEAGLVVGAPFDGELAAAGGAAYLCDLGTGELRGVLRKDGSRPDDLFGTALAGLGARVLVGVPGDDAGVVDGGAAYVFSGSTLEAVFRKRLSAAAFGASVAAVGADVLVGAPGGGSGGGTGSRVGGRGGGGAAALGGPAPGPSPRRARRAPGPPPRRPHRRAARHLPEGDPGDGRLLRRGRRGPG